MILEILPTGLWGSNCYIIGNNGDGAVIDPGADPAEILDAIRKNSLELKYIFLTHAHLDHFCSMGELSNQTNAKIVMHKADTDTLVNPLYNAVAFLEKHITFQNADILVEDGDVLEVGALKLEIIHTPGHTPGCMCIKINNKIFTGDTLFRLAIGRTDLGNGNYENIIDSIKNKLMTLDDDIIVYPGHNDSTTIGFERRKNPFLK